MFKHILVAADGSALSLSAVRAAAQLAASTGAKLSGIFVAMEYPGSVYPEYVAFSPMTYEDYTRESDAEAHKVLAALRRETEQIGVPCQTLSKRHTHAYKAIIEAANQDDCDLIVMASHGRRGMSAMVLGSETNKVLTHSKIPVLVYR
jgi:nucleotide-binding universal stress UspA family protein